LALRACGGAGFVTEEVLYVDGGQAAGRYTF
jgi:hypothetical protein